LTVYPKEKEEVEEEIPNFQIKLEIPEGYIERAKNEPVSEGTSLFTELKSIVLGEIERVRSIADRVPSWLTLKVVFKGSFELWKDNQGKSWLYKMFDWAREQFPAFTRSKRLKFAFD